MKSLKVYITGSNHPSVLEDQRIQTSCCYTAYNAFEDIEDVKRGFSKFSRFNSQKEIYHDCTSKFKINSHLINSAVREGKTYLEIRKASDGLIEKKNRRREKRREAEIERLIREQVINPFKKAWKNRKHALKKIEGQARQWHRRHKKGWRMIFGDFEKRCKKLISKAEYRESKLIPLTSEGEANQKGNRLFKFEFRGDEIFLIYKRSRKEHIEFKLSKHLNKLYKSEIVLLKEAMENRELPVTISINPQKCEAIITFDDEKLYKDKKEEVKSKVDPRITMALDLNPHYTGVAIVKRLKKGGFKIQRSIVYDLKELVEKSSKNKKKHELIEINHQLLRLCKHHKVSRIIVEKLVMPTEDKGKGKGFNKLCNNDWSKSIVVSNLKTLCIREGIEFVEIGAAYSSTIGNILYGSTKTPDMVAAAIELARRGGGFEDKDFGGGFLPTYDKSLIQSKCAEKFDDRWKEIAWMDVKGWKELHNDIKSSGLRYRVRLDGIPPPCRQRFYHKMMISKSFYI